MPNLVASLAPAGTFTAGGTGTITAGSLNFGTNADRAVAMLVTSISSDVAAVISSVVVGGVTLTAGANIDISNEYSAAGSKGRIFTGTGIPSGSQSVSINWANPNFVGHHVGYAAMAFDDAPTLTVTDAGTGTSGTAPTITLTSASGDLMAAFGAWQPDVRATVTAPSAEQFDGLATAQTGTFYGETQTAASSSTTLAATAASNTAGWRMWGLRVEGAAAAPVITGPSGTGSVLTGNGSCSTTGSTGLLWWKADASSTASDPGAGSEAGAGWTSQAVSGSGTQTVASFGALTAGTKYVHYLHVDGSSNRSTVADSSSFTVLAAAANAPRTFRPLFLNL